MGADKGKKLKVEEKTEVEEVDHIDGELVLSIEKLQEIQDELEKVNEEASDEVLVVEQKYTLIRRPVYDKRNEIIKSIPDFWLTAFISHPALGDLLNEDDQKIFKYLKSMDVEDCKDVKSGYSITFNFNENPYFENASLVKSFLFSDEGTTKITGTKINWKEGMDIISNGVVHEKKGNKRSHDEESFFTWFCDDQDKTLLEVLHDEVAEVIKEDLWPNPLKYFNNEADEDFDDEEGEEGDEEGKEDDEDDEDDEDAEE